MDKMEDPNAHDIIQLKAAQLATELSSAIYRTSYEGVFQVKNQAEHDREEWGSRFSLLCYLEQKGIICHTLAQYKEAPRKLDKEEEERAGRAAAIKVDSPCSK